MNENLLPIETRYFKEFEQVLEESHLLEKLLDPVEEEKLLFNDELKLLPDKCKEILSKIENMILEKYGLEPNLILRSSLVSEDWLSDRFAGVSRSRKTYDYNLWGGGIEFKKIYDLLYRSFKSIVLSKHGLDQFVKMGRDENLAFQVAPYIDFKQHITAVCYKDGKVRVQILDKKFSRSPYSTDCYFSTFEISRDLKEIKNIRLMDTNSVKFKERWIPIVEKMPYRIDEFFSPISIESLKCIAKLAQYEKQLVGLESIDIELLNNNENLTQVQIRPSTKTTIRND